MTTYTDLHDGWRVNSIATPREAFVSCTPDELMADVVERNTERFDFMPVLSGEGTVLGIVELVAYFDASPPRGAVSEFFVTLGERHLIGADASIVAFVMNADEHRFRFVVSRKGIVGLVSLSDLQKLAVRVTLFSLVTELELLMLETIRRFFPEPTAWQRLLHKNRRLKIAELLDKAAAADGVVDALLYTQFCDKRDILLRSLLAAHEQRDRFSISMRAIEDLRNSLAHANEYADTSAKAAGVSQIAREVIAVGELLKGLQLSA